MDLAKFLTDKLTDDGLINAISKSEFNHKFECCEMTRSDNFLELIKSIEIMRMPFEWKLNYMKYMINLNNLQLSNNLW